MLRAIVMKAHLLLLPLAFLLALVQPLAAQQASQPKSEDRVEWQFSLWCSTKIPFLDLKELKFEEGYDRLVQLWAQMGSKMAFPFSLDDFEVDADFKGSAPQVSLSLRQVPFAEALDLLCKGTGRKIIPKSGPFRLQTEAPAGGWDTRVYPLTPALQEQLFGSNALPDGVQALDCYERFGIHGKSWMYSCLVGDRLFVLANEEQHHQIALINRLLAEGYTITPPAKK